MMTRYQSIIMMMDVHTLYESYIFDILPFRERSHIPPNGKSNMNIILKRDSQEELSHLNEHN